jgi:hypothetical protein
MHRMRKGTARGVVGGLVGLGAVELVRRTTTPLVTRRGSDPRHVFLTERSMSPFGPQHELGEGPSEAAARLAYQKLVGTRPSRATTARGARLVRIASGLLIASVYGALRGGRRRRAVVEGLALGAGLWLVADEILGPLLGLTDKPTAYHPTHHAQALAQRLGFGVATAATVRVLEVSR